MISSSRSKYPIHLLGNSEHCQQLTYYSADSMIPLQDANQARSFPFFNWFILILNVLFFLFEISMSEGELNAFIEANGFVPVRFAHDFGLGEIMTIFSSMFMHAGWMHLISNMWALHIFGDNVEDKMGHGNYVIFYIICGIAAALTDFLVHPGSGTPTIGASGALAGVLGAYLVLFPAAKIITLIPIIIIPYFVELPAIVFLGFWFLSQFFTGLGSLDNSPVAAEASVAWWAHIGGFIAGMILVKLFEKREEYNRYYQDEYYPW